MREEDWIPSVDEICAAFHSAVGTKDDAFTQIRKLIVNCYTYRDGAPAPVRDAAESGQGDEVDDEIRIAICVAANEPTYSVEHESKAWTQLTALRARVAGLEAERDAIALAREGAHQAVRIQSDELRELRLKLTDARALLAVERERVIEECAKVCDARVEELSLGRPSPYHSQPSLEDRRDAQIDGLNDIARQLRALAQPRAERETK